MNLAEQMQRVTQSPRTVREVMVLIPNHLNAPLDVLDGDLTGDLDARNVLLELTLRTDLAEPMGLDAITRGLDALAYRDELLGRLEQHAPAVRWAVFTGDAPHVDLQLLGADGEPLSRSHPSRLPLLMWLLETLDGLAQEVRGAAAVSA